VYLKMIMKINISYIQYIVFYIRRPVVDGPARPWSYCSWMYNYLSNECLSSRISIRARGSTLCDKVYQRLATCRWFSTGHPVSSTNKTDRHDIAEILLKVTLNTTKPNQKSCSWILNFAFKDSFHFYSYFYLYYFCLYFIFFILLCLSLKMYVLFSSGEWDTKRQCNETRF
jgi:hypothetical protein